MLKGVYAKSPFITMAFVDGGCNSDEAQRAAFEASRISITVAKRNDKQIKDFVVLPKRWVVERTFGWINRARRLSKNFEATLESALALFQIALAFLIMRRLARWVRRVSSQVLRMATTIRHRSQNTAPIPLPYPKRTDRHGAQA